MSKAQTGARTDRTNPWSYVPADIARRIGLTGAGDTRMHNDCVYRRDEHGDWWELEVPKLPAKVVT